MYQFVWWVYLILAIPGLFLYFMNWSIFIHNCRGGKFVSGIVLIGGIWLAVAALISPWKWLALIGLTDPGVWLLIWSLISEFIPRRTKHDPE